MPFSFPKAIYAVFTAVIFSGLMIGMVFQRAAAAENFSGFRQDATLAFLDDGGAARTVITVEIADSPAAKRKGLMGRVEMDDTVGMLFVYDNAADRAFWMRNTILSLDIIFVSAARRIINIAKRTTPYTEDILRSTAPAKYVVEVRAGFCDRYGIRPGTRVKWQLEKMSK